MKELLSHLSGKSKHLKNAFAMKGQLRTCAVLNWVKGHLSNAVSVDNFI
jgi:hypothetical protein